MKFMKFAAAAAIALFAVVQPLPLAADAASETYTAQDGAVYTIEYKTERVSILGCETDLETVCVPTEIGGLPVWYSASAYDECPTIKAFTVEDNDSGYYVQDGVLFQDTELIAYPCAKTDETYAVPEGTDFLLSGSIANNPYLRRVDIPASVTKCYTIMGGCPKLFTINVDENSLCFSSQNGLFMNKDQTVVYRRAPSAILTNCILPDTVEKIDGRAFMDNARMVAITLPKGLKSIGVAAFSGCTGLTKITLPSSLQSIDYDAFSGCTGLTQLVIPEGVEKIWGYAFENCTSLKSVQLPETLTDLQLYAFAGCTALETVNIPESVTEIPHGVFDKCSSLREITLHAGVEKIGYAAFGDTAGLEKITILNPRCDINGMDGFLGPSAIYSGSTVIDGVTKLVYNMTICGYDGSTAELYAEQRGIAFESLGAPPHDPGDLDLDGEVTAADASLVLIYAAELGSGVPTAHDENWLAAADFNNDETIDATDAAQILIYAASLGAGA